MSPARSKPAHWPAFAFGAVTVLCAALLWNTLGSPPAAYGQVPDSGAQRNAMIKELRTANKHLAEMTKLLHEIRDAQKATPKPKGPKPPKKP